MLNHLAFIKRTLPAGVVLGSGAMFNGCAGLKRKNFQDTNRSVENLDNTANTILCHAGLAPSGHNSQPWRVRIKKRRTVKHGHLPKEITAADVKRLSDGMKGHLTYFPRRSNHAACIRDAAVENYRIQAGRDDAQQELVRWLRLNPRDAERHRTDRWFSW